MQIQIHSKPFKLTKALKKYAESKLKLALQNSHDKFNKVVMRLSDTNGPKGGVDKQCQVLVVLPGMPDVVVSQKNEDMYQAIDRAVERASFAVTRRIERKLAMRRDKINKGQILTA